MKSKIFSPMHQNNTGLQREDNMTFLLSILLGIVLFALKSTLFISSYPLTKGLVKVFFYLVACNTIWNTIYLHQQGKGEQRER